MSALAEIYVCECLISSAVSVVSALPPNGCGVMNLILLDSVRLTSTARRIKDKGEIKQCGIGEIGEGD